MVKTKGYAGNILEVNLSLRELSSADLDSDTTSNFLGGRGYGIKLLKKNNPKGVDPLLPENNLIFMTGPYTGTGPFSAFYSITTKSPLTGLCLSSHSGGNWGPSLKRAGYDGIVIEGKADDPVMLVISDGKPKLENIRGLWGRNTAETTEKIEKEYGASPAVIGPAGENKVRYACIVNNYHRVAGRGGAGAVMGSKNLKAIAVKGDKDIEIGQPEEMKKKFIKAAKTVQEEAQAFGKLGTPIVVNMENEIGGLPTKNFQIGYFEDAEKVSGEYLHEKYWVEDFGCFRCPLSCGNVTEVKQGKYKCKTEGPEYETIMAFGPNCYNSNLESIIKANDLCDRLGLDTITMGDSIAFCMELYERDLIDENDIGFSLDWGDHKKIIELVKMTANREGFGDELAEGTWRIAQKRGGEPVQVGKMEPPGYEPRAIQGMALAYATSPRGACHLRATMYVPETFSKELDRTTVKGKTDYLIDMQNKFAILDSMLLCKLGGRNANMTRWEDLSELLEITTGKEFSVKKLKMIGKKIFNLEHKYNVREGKKNLSIPTQFFEPQEYGPSEGLKVKKEDFEKAIDEYQNARGWK
ncbi:hypothetical protein AKJ66_03565 [candidate division MSBL1 archaeon SCGC-AAA259E22]|uniref:Aldehyde ferredoxin oxidoreductase N-terminal domain-containing protein n=1 Tax=candidate division MSBL1 archaeon SCGC-AAA259E22 TaxID=1698265 RepID=A0A133UF20_9EURY|nr:hypothetical protein AKJ66_03565 [candidate division MSBL1 archaeon SCGC-AAA259E22]